MNSTQMVATIPYYSGIYPRAACHVDLYLPPIESVVSGLLKVLLHQIMDVPSPFVKVSRIFLPDNLGTIIYVDQLKSFGIVRPLVF